MDIPQIWGATPGEQAMAYPCDAFAVRAAEVWYRAVTIHAPRPVVFRWLCQLKVAPYSYDLLDNYGRRSPRQLTPGADILAVGQPVMTIFELVDFEADRHLTLRMRSERGLLLFGAFTLTYAVSDPAASHSAAGDHLGETTRLVVKMLVGDHARDRAPAALRRKTLAWGDLLMMRRQLRTLRTLAEGGSRRW